VHPRPSIYVYNGRNYNTFDQYIYKGTYPEETILSLIGSHPYRKTFMRIKYSLQYYWRNVIIDLTNGWYYIIDPTTTTGSAPVASPLVYVNGTAINGTQTAPPGTPTEETPTLSTTTESQTIVANPSTETVDNSGNQDSLRKEDAQSQEALSIEVRTEVVESSANTIVASAFALFISAILMMVFI
jgi:hypothetical protein